MKIFKKSGLIYYKKGPEWVEKIRLKISTILLDFAERLPEVKAGFLHQLQFIREMQRERSENDNQLYQIPEGVEVELLGFHLIELFHLEEFLQIENTLKSLFPDRYALHGDDFDEFHGNMTYGGWRNLGVLVPTSNKRSFTSDRKKVLDKLSSKIDFIKLTSHQVMPSVLTLLFTVHLTESTGKEFLSFFKETYLPPTKIGWYRRKLDFLPTSDLGFLNSGAGAEFSKWSKDLQINVEECLRDFFQGYFYSNKKGKIKLPRIDLFALKNTEHSNGKNDDRKNRRWESALGFNVFPEYSNDEMKWHSHEKRGKYSWPSKIIVDFDQYIGDANVNPFGGNRNYIFHKVGYWIEQFVSPFSLQEYFQVEVSKVAKLRQNVFKKENIGMKMNTRRPLDLLTKVERNSIILDRILMEFELVEEYLKRVLQKTTGTLIADFASSKLPLNINFFDRLERKKRMLEKQNNYLQNSINRIVSVVNLRATRRMTLLAIIISGVSLIVAVVALEIDWNSFLKTLGF